jgi:hypothetical protein
MCEALMKKAQILTPLDPYLSPAAGKRAGEHRKLRSRDLEALRRMQDHGPLTIPKAYDCGHGGSETTGHGMNRLVAATLAIFHGWDATEDDALWTITEEGRQALRAVEDRRISTRSC